MHLSTKINLEGSISRAGGEIVNQSGLKGKLLSIEVFFEYFLLTLIKKIFNLRILNKNMIIHLNNKKKTFFIDLAIIK